MVIIKKFRGILFDMDGVLIDSEKATRTACIEALKQWNIHAKEEDFTPFVGMGEEMYIGGVARKYGGTYVSHMDDETYRLYGEKYRNQIDVFVGVKEMLLELKSLGYKIAVASAARKDKVMVNIQAIGVNTNIFDSIVTGSDVKNKKPDPEIYLKAASNLAIPPCECIVLEDAISGTKAAKSAGATAVGVLSSFKEQELRSAGSDFIIEKTQDFMDLVKQIDRK